MLEVRTANKGDRERFRELWKICFGDSEAFMDWFFEERFFPEFSSCLLEDGVIMSALQSYPLHVRLRDAILPASMLAGVSTHPERNGRGYMKQIFSHYMQRVRNMGIPIAIHTPANLPTFFARGHLPATNTLHVSIHQPKRMQMPDDIGEQDMYRGLAPLQACYQHCTASYSGCVSRTMGDFAYKMRDYASDGGQCLVRLQGEEALGYCMYYAMPERVHVEECFAKDQETLHRLIDALCSRAQGRELHIKLPPDVKLDRTDVEILQKPQGVMGVANISMLLRLLIHDADYVFQVEDGTVSQNAGIWDGMGNQCGRSPQMIVQAGKLGQFLCGYHSLAELLEAGEAQVNSRAALEELDRRFPKQTCFITDEY